MISRIISKPDLLVRPIPRFFLKDGSGLSNSIIYHGAFSNCMIISFFYNLLTVFGLKNQKFKKIRIEM